MGGSGEQIRTEFAKRQGRQSVAIAAAMLLIIVFALLYARPGWLGPNSRTTIFSAQIVVIAGLSGAGRSQAGNHPPTGPGRGQRSPAHFPFLSSPLPFPSAPADARTE